MIYTLSSPEQPLRFVKKDLSSYLRRAAQFQSKDLVKEEFFSNSPPSIFVGSKLSYPNVNVGILTPPEHSEDTWLYDAEHLWPGTALTIQDIVRIRSSLINARFQTTVFAARSQAKFLDIAQEIGMASSPVDVEIHLKKKVRIHLDTDKIHLPMGPRASLRHAAITENPKITTKVDKVVSDTDLKAADALAYLYQHNMPGSTLSRLLSIGILGLKKDRKLVPTRFSITATDDVLGKHLLKSIRDLPVVSEYLLYTGNYFGNYYVILLFPDVWSYELFEMYIPGSAWNSTSTITAATEYEGFHGRKAYASSTAGGYYSVRLAVLEKLVALKRQASVLVIRLETPEYHTGLGVWVTREAARKAARAPPLVCTTHQELVQAAQQKIKEQVNIDVTSLLRRSRIVAAMNEQVKLTSFLS